MRKKKEQEVTLNFWERTWETIKGWFVEDDDMPKSLQGGKGIFCFFMVIVSLLHFSIFYIGVNYKSILLAFQTVDYVDSDGVLHYAWTLQHFKNFFAEMSMSDTILPLAFKNTLKFFVVDSIILFISGYVISYFLYKKISGTKLFRIFLYVPSIVSSVVVVAVFKNFVSLGGPFHQIVYKATGKELPSLFSDQYALNTIMSYVVWRGIASNFILFTGAMNRIPEEIIESAKIEGCGWLREIWTFILPLTWDTVATLWLMSWIGIFSASGPILLFNTGESTYTLSYWIYLQVTSGSYSYPAAVGLLLTVVSFPLVLLIRGLLNLVETVEY